MRKRRFTREQVIDAVREHEAGLAATVICHRHGISEQTFRRWKAKYGGAGTLLTKYLRNLEEENRRLKRRLAETTLNDAANVRRTAKD